MKKVILFLLFLLSLSVCLNLFQWSNAAVTCDNIDAHWKVDLLYFLGHKHLDWDKDWIPCEHLSPNQE
jgi:hypothetical protein